MITTTLIQNELENETNVLVLGGEAVRSLREVALNKQYRSKAIQLLLAIEQETMDRLGYRASKIFCPQCLTRFNQHTYPLLKWKTLTYYGCRICSQSRDFFDGQIIAVLDRSMRESSIRENGEVYINWLQLRTLFDFTKVEIIDATDEDVERFVTQLKNDTVRNEFEISYTIHCNLSENTRRILKWAFE